MTTNGLQIDPTHPEPGPEVVCRLQQISTYPSSVVNKSLEILSKVINKHLDVKIGKKSDSSIYEAIETL